MGLKCTLLGHSFDETDVEREREERGSEVVTIVQEVERCSRCGETRVVSENKEVTSIVEPDDAGDEAPTAVDAAAEADATDTAGGYESGSDLDEYEPTTDPEEDDAEILEDDRPADRQPGQWPGDEDDWSPDDLTREAAAETDDPEPTPDETDEAAAADPDDDGPALAAGNEADGTYVCTDCGYEVRARDSPFRAGDACPECQSGYLEADAE